MSCHIGSPASVRSDSVAPMPCLARIGRHITSVSRLTVGALAVAACGGTSTPAPATPETEPREADGAASTGGGVTGMPGLDWGATTEVVQATFPSATANPDGGLWVMGSAEGIESITSFQIGAAGLEAIRIEWSRGFVSMQECSTHWTTFRTKFDGQWGASQADNLAAYWTTPTASITLACNPNESDAGVLSMSYAPPAPADAS